MATGDVNITKEQLDIAKSLSDVMKQLAQSQEALMSLTSTFEQMSSTASKSADKLSESSKTTTSSVLSLNSAAKKAGGVLHSKFPIAAAAAAGGIIGLYQHVKRLTQLMRTATGLIKGTADALLDIGASIVSIPFKMLNGLVDIVNNASGGANELLQAIENIRKEFGALGQGTPQAIMKMAKELQGFSDTGLSAWRIFGMMHQRLEDILKLSQEMGATFESFRDEMVSNGGAILAWQKGLGLTGEQMGIVAQRAKTMGTSMSKQFIDVQKQVDALSGEFKVSSKLIARDMVKAMADLKHFGSSAAKEILTAATYARKLGLELDKIVGTLDAFDTFESAAENASMLSQAFGVQVDAFQLMKAQSPDEIIESLRKSFREANVDVTKFDRASMSLLATTTHLDAATAKQALSLHNQGVSLDQIRAKAGAAEKKQLTQAEAMEKLASAIERLVLSGGQQSGGFFDKFVNGMMGGIQRGKEFRGIMMNIRAAFRTVYWEGVRFGKAIANIPGIKDFLGAIKSFFDPKKFGTLVRGVTDELIKFVKGEQSFPELMKKLKEQFFDYFDANSEAGKKFMNGVKSIFKGMANVAAEAMKWMAERVRDGIVFITDLLTGKRKLDLSAVTAGAGFLGEVLAPMIEALKYSWKTVAPALGQLFSVLGGMIEKFFKEKVVPLFQRFAPEIAIGLFGPAFAKAAFAALTAAFAQSQLRKALSGGVGDAMKSIVASASASGASAAGATAAGAAQVTPALTAVSKVSVSAMVASGVKMAAIAGAIALGGIVLAHAFVEMKNVLAKGNLTTENIIANIAILGTMVLAAAGIAMTMTIFNKIPSVSVLGKAILGMGAAALMIGALGVLGNAIVGLFDSVDIAKLGPVGDFLLKMSAVTLAMVPVLFGAAALGTLVIGTLGLGLIAMAAGMGIIIGAVGAIALMAKSVMSEVNDMKISSDFQVKINAFLGVLESLRSFSQLLVNLVSMMTPTLGELLFGGPTFVQKVNATIDLLKHFVGERGGKVGIIPIVELVVEKIREIAGLGDIDQAANSFSNILTSVTGLMEALKPNDAFFKSKEGIVGLVRLISGDNGIEEVRKYVTIMSDQLVKLIRGDKDGKGGLNEMIETMAGVTVPDPAKLKVIGETLGSLSGLVKAVLPDPELFNKFMDDEKFDPTRFLWFLDDYFPRMQAVLSSIIKIGVDDIIKSLDQIGDPEKFKKLLVVGEVLKTVSDLVKNVMEMGSGGGKTNIEKIEVDTLTSMTGKLEILTGPTQSLAATISEMGPAIAGLMTSITVATLLVPNDKGFKGKVETLKSMLEVMKLVPSLVKDVAEVNKEAAKGGGDYTPMTGSVLDAITNARTLLDNMIGGDRLTQLGATMKTAAAAIPRDMSSNMSKVESFLSKLSNIVRGLKSISEMFKSSGGEKFTANELSQSVIDSIDAVKTVADAMSPRNTSGSPIGMLSEAFGAEARAELVKVNADMNLYAKQIDMMSKNFKSGGISKALNAFDDMSKKVGELHAALDALPVIDIDAKLKAVASGLGMTGKKFEYSLKSKEIVIQVNFNVEMSASDVEKAVVLRKESFIRDRLNIMLDQSDWQPGTDASMVPSPLRLEPGTSPGIKNPNR